MTTDMDTRTAIENLLLVADECSKKVITAFDPTAPRAATNIKALSKFNFNPNKAGLLGTCNKPR